MVPHTPETPTILVVDDEPQVLQLLTDILATQYKCVGVGSAEEALAELRTRQFGIVVSDINLGGLSGVEMIPHVHELSPDTVVMMISGDLSLDSPIQAMRKGAFDYLQKPFDVQHVLAAAARALAHHDLLTAKRRHEEELEKLVEERTARLNFLTYHDALTSLPNRTLLEDRLGQLIVRDPGENRNAVMLISFGRLRTIRETLGNEAANSIIGDIAGRIQELVDADVTLGRVDGDIFAVLLPDCSVEQCVHISGVLAAALGRSFNWAGNDLHLTCKVGVSLHPNDGEEVATLMQNASSALAHAREQAGSVVEFYSDGMSAFAADRLSLENDLRSAIERRDIGVHYQPKIDLESGRITGMEALARWNHPTRGFVPPDVFIKLAEDIEIVGKIDELVLRLACDRTREWQKAGFDIELAVNLSGVHLQEKNCATRVLQILAECDFDPVHLNLEVTETAIMQDLELSIDQLKTLRDSGIKISIDDFGTGYSSLNAFKSLPLDVLKIDRSFVNDLAEKPLNAAFVKTIIELAHLLNVRIVAEGVENGDQISVLRELGCDEWQGYLFSRPVPAEEFSELLHGDAIASGS
jgi:diguanylate cyclase (GGDEF)-like protein